MFILSDKDVKIAYVNKFDEEGFHYDQMVTLSLTPMQYEGYNNYVTMVLTHTNSSSPVKLYLKRLATGDNYTNITTFSTVATYFNFRDNKRLKQKRNTIIRVKIKEEM